MAFPEFVPGGRDSFADMLAEQMAGRDEADSAPQTPTTGENHGGGFKVVARTDEKGRLAPVIPEGSVAYLRRQNGEREVKIHGPQHLLAGRPNVVFKAPES